MLSKQNIAIISGDFLSGYGLKALFYEYFTPAKVDVFATVADYHDSRHSYHLLILPAVDYLVHLIRLTVKNKIVTIAAAPPQSVQSAQGQPPHLYTLCSEQEMVEQLQNILTSFESLQSGDAKNELSERECEVLAKVAQGAINKEIADSLNISLNTVITHRKNITAKLGIKTISGLTVYAILNGIIAGEDLPKS
ncbi:MAG: LuxR C-terminal-related transcriptional regulator [Prevotellaceae bacterium]|jgi:DNA-binding CsgD family transcriptional regulator|nr:LuxR C-terminal-related transcriptional regulator [Prevotellaceae bacterium]